MVVPPCGGRWSEGCGAWKSSTDPDGLLSGPLSAEILGESSIGSCFNGAVKISYRESIDCTWLSSYKESAYSYNTWLRYSEQAFNKLESKNLTKSLSSFGANRISQYGLILQFQAHLPEPRLT